LTVADELGAQARLPPSGAEAVESGACERREIADSVLVVGGERGSAGLVRELE
jgi:hypothetical protein